MEKQLKNPIEIERIELGHVKKIRRSVGQLQLHFYNVRKSSKIRKNLTVKIIQ